MAGTGDFPCDACSIRFLSLEALKDHAGAVHCARVLDSAGRSRNQCNMCEKSFAGSAAVHFVRCHTSVPKALLSKSVVRPKDARCEGCAKLFDKSQLPFHWLRMHQSKVPLTRKPREPVTCDACGLILVQKFALKNHFWTKHMLGHVPASNHRPAYVCDVCGLASKNRHHHWAETHALPEDRLGSFKAGDLNYASVKAQNIFCSDCNIQFAKSQQMFCHWVFCHSTLPVDKRRKAQARKRSLQRFLCEDCGKGLESRCRLRIHMGRHMPFREAPSRPASRWRGGCEECGQICASKFNLTKHILSKHGGVSGLNAVLKDAFCDDCGRPTRLPSHFTSCPAKSH